MAVAHSGSIGEVYATAGNTLGLVIDGADSSGATAAYIYLEGCADTKVGSVVTYDELGKSALLIAGASGPIAVATAKTVASTFGWYGTNGTFLTDVVASCADNAPLGPEGDPGQVGDGFTVAISNAISRGETPAEMPDPPVLTLCQFKNSFISSPPSTPVGTRRKSVEKEAEPKAEHREKR